MEELFELTSLRFVVDALTILDNPLELPNPSLLGDDCALSLLLPIQSLLLDIPICFGLENNFFLVLSDFCFDSTTSVPACCRGNAILAAVAAAAEREPTSPFWYVLL